MMRMREVRASEQGREMWEEADYKRSINVKEIFNKMKCKAISVA